VTASDSDAPPPGRLCAAGLLVTPDGRYLMQLRDDKPRIFLPGHWGLFGGSIDPGEDAAAAMRRELSEELEFAARSVRIFTDMTIGLPLPDAPRNDRLIFFEVPVEEADIARMVLHEGSAMRLFRPEALTAEPRVAPWDLAAVLMHARQATLFRRKE